MDKIERYNPESQGMLVGAIVMFGSIIAAFIPQLLSLDMMQWGYGIVTISLFFFIIGLVTYKTYAYRFKVFSHIISGENVLAHWSYPKEKYLEHVNQAFQEKKNSNLAIYKIVLFFFVLFTVIFLLIGFSSGEGDSMLFFTMIMGGSLLIISIAAFLAPIVERNQSLKSLPEAIIGKDGMYYLGKLHTWGTLLFILHKVGLNKWNTHISFEIKYFTRVGWYKYEKYIVQVEIPEGHLEEAKQVIQKLHQD